MQVQIFVKKKDGALWFVQDYQVLNAMTVKNWYPLPLINNLISRSKGAQCQQQPLGQLDHVHTRHNSSHP
jgi:hypothetical protein